MSDQADRRTRAITAGLSATGATAGVGGLAYAAHDAVNTVRAGKKIPLKTKALIPLEAAGLTGEVMATKILHNDAKKKTVVKAMSRLDMDPKNGKGRRIVVENAESAEENKEENSVPVTRKRLLAMANEVKNGASMKSEVEKARYFDPEADRQRRLGLYSGAAVGGAIAAGSVAHSKGEFGFEREAGDSAKKMSPKYTLRANRKGVAAAGTSLGLAALAAGTYKRGISHRNQPWN
jgi:hypothetical protein